jgi:hypothetical protein
MLKLLCVFFLISQAGTVSAGHDSGDATLGVASVPWHALDLGKPVRIADNGRAHSVLDVEVLEVPLDIGRGLAKCTTLLGALRLPVKPGVLREPGWVVTDGGALVQVKQDLGNTGSPCGGVRAGVAERDHRAFGLGEKRVFGGLGTVTPGHVAEGPATLLEKRVRMFRKERLVGIRNGEGVAAEDELTPETDAQCKDVSLSYDDTVQIGLLIVVSGLSAISYEGKNCLVARDEVGVERALCTAALSHLMRAFHCLANNCSLDEHRHTMLDSVSCFGIGKDWRHLAVPRFKDASRGNGV